MRTFHACVLPLADVCFGSVCVASRFPAQDCIIDLESNGRRGQINGGLGHRINPRTLLR